MGVIMDHSAQVRQMIDRMIAIHVDERLPDILAQLQTAAMTDETSFSVGITIKRDGGTVLLRATSDVKRVAKCGKVNLGDSVNELGQMEMEMPNEGDNEQ